MIELTEWIEDFSTFNLVGMIVGHGCIGDSTTTHTVDEPTKSPPLRLTDADRVPMRLNAATLPA